MRPATVSPVPSGTPISARGRLIAALAAGLARLDFTTPRAAYVLRSTLAALLALTVAYSLELEMPYSAATTVLLVLNPLQGAVIGKGSWRLLGTLVGMVAALALMAAFAQMPWLFVLADGLWLGMCVAAMSLLRHFRAYGAAVAGYTIGLATLGAMQHPEHAFEQAVGRAATVAIGVICLGLVSALFSRRSVRGKLEALVGRLAAGTANAIASRHDTSNEGSGAGTSARTAPEQRRLMTEIYGVDDLLALGKAESADLAQRAVAVRHAMASLFAALVGGAPPLPAHGASTRAWRTLQPALENAWRTAEQALAGGAQGIDPAIAQLRQARARLTAALDESTLNDPAQEAAWLIVGDRLVEQIDDYLAALAGIAALHRPSPRGAARSVRFHRDTTAALENGLRAMLVMVSAGALWIATGWPAGDVMVLIIAPYCALLSPSPNPAAGAVQFLKGTLYAIPAAFLCAFGVLPHTEGMPLLSVVLALFWLPGIYATSVPAHTLAGLAYLVGFNTLVAADNPMHYDLARFMNWSLAWFVGTALTLLGFRIFLPRDPVRDIERLRRRIRDEALALLRGAAADRRLWQLRQQHRMAQLGAMLKARPATMDHAIGDALASLHLGRELLRLRQWLRQAPPASAMRPLVAAALDRMARRADAPLKAAGHARRAALGLRRIVIDGAPGGDRHRLAAALTDIAALLEAHAGYFSTLSRGPAHAQ
ncbi:multidrug efflux protein [Bordetella ansorpii]|uniref:Multidrug efflux protein n=1 Tax=Bordetella ansorpii TaxID=288768 RepID=A0A157RNR4_9BORD|nr:multidrug efflux protein [Bordetella ansorpii]